MEIKIDLKSVSIRRQRCEALIPEPGRYGRQCSRYAVVSIDTTGTTGLLEDNYCLLHAKSHLPTLKLLRNKKATKEAIDKILWQA